MYYLLGYAEGVVRNAEAQGRNGRREKTKLRRVRMSCTHHGAGARHVKELSGEKQLCHLFTVFDALFLLH